MATMRALARTVDLLGRQQVATVQNALVWAIETVARTAHRSICWKVIG